MEGFQIRTDLAVELKEDIDIDEGKGIVVEEIEESQDIKVTVISVLNEKGAGLINKPIGNYITLETKKLNEEDISSHREISKVLAKYLHKLILPFKKRKDMKILVVGLGNRNVTPDALGPNVTENINIELGIRTIAPGVLAQTGMETAAIIKGIVREEHPDVLIAIDALAAKTIERLNCTIQLTDTGIEPGSGVGNHRNAINRQTMNIPVIALGVPTVIDAPALVNDTFDSLIGLLNNKSVLKEFSREEKYKLIKEIINPNMTDMFVTPKDTDATIKRIGYTISEAINIAVNKGI